jgi:hypothetical protein
MDSLREFDLKEASMNHEEPLVVILRAHLGLEAVLIALISRALPNPESLDLDRMSFSTKVGLAAALGTIPLETVPALRQLNTLRNVFAHNFRAELKEEHVQALVAKASFLGDAIDLAHDADYRPSSRIGLIVRVVQAAINGYAAASSPGSALPQDHAERATAVAAHSEQRYPLPPE